MRALLLLASIACLALVAVPTALASPVQPPCGAVLDRDHPTDPHDYVTCGPYWCEVNLQVGIRCFG